MLNQSVLEERQHGGNIAHGPMTLHLRQVVAVDQGIHIVAAVFRIERPGQPDRAQHPGAECSPQFAEFRLNEAVIEAGVMGNKDHASQLTFQLIGNI